MAKKVKKEKNDYKSPKYSPEEEADEYRKGKQK